MTDQHDARHNRAQAFRLIPALVLATAVAACGGGDEGSAAASPVAAPAATPAASPTATPDPTSAPQIVIQNFAFMPSTLRVKVGQQITVINKDQAGHTVTADDGSFGTGELAQGQTATFTVSKPGTYPYHCDIHQYMKATLVVS